ncbi:hypothetical protein [Tianweitania sediminis]|uniref:Uncharacterized protein n=1 Tax=Tianweitania sediminis TaxID=1502156 RepID=A0A8J7RRF4_9HYPH|nr:hypothetical protein [Tianweitania sediminis]MBP0440694.1 hypothetical protein [Tianweitania sediminis]
MPLSQNPSEDGYPVGPTDRLSVEFMQAVLDSLHGRLQAVEAAAEGFEDAVGDEAIALAEGRLNDSVVPQLTDLQAEIQALQDEIAAAGDQLAAIQAGGVVANLVTLAPVSGLDATTAQQAIAEIVGNAAGTDENIVALTADVGTRQPASEKGQPGGYASLDEDGKVPAAQVPVTGLYVSSAPVTAVGAAVDILGIDCDDLILTLDGVSHDSGSNANLGLSYSTDGSAFVSWGSLSGNTTAASALNSVFFLTGLKIGRAVITGGSAPNISQSSYGGGVKPMLPIVALRLAWSSGNFDAGTIYVEKRWKNADAADGL